MIYNIIILSIREIRRNLLRSILTTLGIVIGVASVVMIVTLGEGTKLQVETEISKLGSSMMTVYPGKRRHRGASLSAQPFEIDDVEAIRRESTFVSSVAPMSIKRELIVYGNENRRSQIVGTDSEFSKVRNWSLTDGRYFSFSEEMSGKSVCIIGETIRKELYKDADIIGSILRLGKVSCRVIGLLEPKGQVMFAGDQDDIVVVPLKFFQRRISGNINVDQIYVSAINEDLIDDAKNEVEIIMNERRPAQSGTESLFTVGAVKEMSAAFQGTSAVMTAFLTAIAAISLLVGGIGIMNIMLVSVTERTREIGIRMAIGAREREVLLQFLIESAMLSGFGGLIGIILGLGGAFILAPVMDIPLVLHANLILFAFIFSALVGVVFGYVPARRAAQLDPIEALRYE